MICTLVGVFIALPDLFDADDFHAAVPVEQDAVVAYPEPVAVLVMGERLDVLDVGHVSEGLVRAWPHLPNSAHPEARRLHLHGGKSLREFSTLRGVMFRAV